jgi:hypothetical protein
MFRVVFVFVFPMIVSFRFLSSLTLPGFGAKPSGQSFGASAFGNAVAGLGAPSFFGGGSSTSSYIRMVLQGVTPDDEDQLHDV